MQLRPYQATAMSAVQAVYRSGKRAPLLCAPTGSGKCFAPGTPILLFDGRIKRVENVKVGDLLMGPDSTPREVIGCTSGFEEMFRVSPRRGDAYTVNRSHILSLKMTGGSKRSCAIDDGTVVNLTIDDYFVRTKSFRHCAKGWRVAVDFPLSHEPPRLDPYYIGLWLGDGNSSGTGITSADPEIVEFLAQYAAALSLELRVERKAENNKASTYHLTTGERGKGPHRRTNPVVLALDQYRMLKNKHVPLVLKTGTRAVRLAVLAGVLDADGWWSGRGYEITLGNERLLDDVVFIARSLGFSAYKTPCIKTCGNNGVAGRYWRCHINGPVETIPCRIRRKQATKRRQIKDPLVVGVYVESVGPGQFFGFEVTGPDSLFLLGDFTVVHNSAMTKYMLGRTRKRTLYLCHRGELMDMICDDLRSAGIPYGRIEGSKTTHEQIMVGMMQTVTRRLDKLPRFEWVISDEAHLAMAPTWLAILNHYKDAWHLGMSATPCRLDGRGLGEFYDAIVYGPSIRELTGRGYLSPCRAFAPPAADLSQVKKAGADFMMADAARVLNTRSITGDVVRHLREIAPGRRAIVFCCTREHADNVAQQFSAEGIRAVNVDGSMSARERSERIDDFRAGRIQALTNVDLLTTGFDCPQIEVGVFLRPTQSLALYLQMVGRILRIAPGKADAVLLDHVSNVLRHGMPDADREWTLEGRAKRPTAPPVRQCPECYAAFAPAPKCPACQYVFPLETKKRSAPNSSDGTLSEVTETDSRIAQLRNAPLDTLLRAARSYAEVDAIRKARGYHPWWTRRIMQSRNRRTDRAA